MRCFQFFCPLFSRRNGQSLIEILVAVAIGAIMITAAATIIAPVLKINTQAGRTQTAAALGKELIDNVRVFGERDWHNILNLATTSASHYYLSTSSSPFSAVSGNETVVVSTTTYTRYFYVEDVERGVSDGAIVASGGTNDPSTKKVTVAYSWPQGTTTTVSIYLTRNRSNIFSQTDWSGGPEENLVFSTSTIKFSTSTNNIDYSTTTGSITIKFQ